MRNDKLITLMILSCFITTSNYFQTNIQTYYNTAYNFSNNAYFKHVVMNSESNETFESDETNYEAAAFIFPNFLLMAPLLIGVIVDYIGVVDVMICLSFLNFVGSLFLILVRTTGDPLIQMLNQMLFSFSNDSLIICKTVFIANTFLENKDTTIFQRVVCLSSAVDAIFMALSKILGIYFSSDASYDISECYKYLTLATIILCGVNFILNFILRYLTLKWTNISSAETSLVRIKSHSNGHLASNQASLYSAHSMRYRNYRKNNFKFNEYEDYDLPGCLQTMKDIGPVIIFIFTTSAYIDNINDYMATNSSLFFMSSHDKNSANYTQITLLVYSLPTAVAIVVRTVLACIPLKREALEYGYLGSVVMLIIAVATTLLSNWTGFAFYTLSISSFTVFFQLYTPYLIDFKIESLGTAMGIYQLIINIITTLYYFASYQDMDFSNGGDYTGVWWYYVGFLAPLLIGFITFFAFVRYNRRKASQKLK